MNYDITPITWSELKARIVSCDETQKELIAERVAAFTADLDNAVAEAQFSGGRIVGLFDFDADGVTSALIAKKLYPDIDIHIPDRMKDGYGIPEDLSFIRKGDVVLLGDMGSNDVKGLARIRERSGAFPFIVDHHELPMKDIASDADYNRMQAYPRMLNFYQKSPRHIPEYCTAGLMFQIAKQKFRNGDIDRDTEMLCSIYNTFGSIADEIPMNSAYDTTRDDVLAGFNAIETLPLENIAPAFGYFLSRTGLYDEEFMHTSAAQFKVNPVLNASGRIMENGGQFIYDTFASPLPFEKVKWRVDKCIANNDLRKELETKALEGPEFNIAVKSAQANKTHFAICYIPDLNPGICGRAAQKLVEATGVPSICLCGQPDDVRGSARNAVGYPNMLETCGEILDAYGMSFGGHDDAFGLSGTYEAMTRATSRLYPLYSKIQPNITSSIEAIMDLNDLSVNKLLVLEPHGRDFPAPYVAVTDTVTAVKEFARAYGEVRCTSNKDIKFFGQNIPVHKGDTISIVGNADISTFRNKTSVQVNISDIAPVKEKETENELDEIER